MITCWADGPDEYIVPAPGGGFDTTRECLAPAGSCALGLCDEHCAEVHGSRTHGNKE